MEIATAGAEAALVAERVERQHPNSQCCAPFCLSQKKPEAEPEAGPEAEPESEPEAEPEAGFAKKKPEASAGFSQSVSAVFVGRSGAALRSRSVRKETRASVGAAQLRADSCGWLAIEDEFGEVYYFHGRTVRTHSSLLSLCPPTAKVVEEPGLWGAGAAHARRACGIPRSSRSPARRAVPTGRQPPVPPLGRPNHSTGWSERPNAAVEESQAGEGLTARDAALRAAERPRYGELPRLNPCPASLFLCRMV